MRKITCDRCGAEIPKGTPPGYIGLQHEVDGTLVGDNPFEGWDFCENCLKEIIAFIDKKKPEDEERCLEAAPEPEEEANPEPVEQEEGEGRCFEAAPDPEPPKEYKGVNLRRLRELVKEGKSAQEIAAELGCSVAMYYKHRKRAEALYNAGML